MSNRRIVIFNRYNTFSSIGIYSQNLYNAAGTTSELYSVYSRDLFRKKRLGYPGIEITGVFPRNFGLYALNQYFPRITHKKASNILSEVKKESGIVHYSSSLMLPFDKSVDNVVSIHDVIFLKSTGTDSPYLQRKYYIKAFEKFSQYEHILVPTHAVRRELVNLGVDGNISVIPYSVSNIFRKLDNKTDLRKKYNLPADKILILSVSTPAARKNLQMVKEVVSELGSKFKLVRVGSGVNQSINFHGLDAESLNEIYNACDVLLFPTLDEGFGFPNVEAFAAGLPVVTSDIEVCREVADRAALTVDPFSKSELKRAVIDVLNNTEEFVRKGFERSKLYSQVLFSKNLISFYRSI